MTSQYCSLTQVRICNICIIAKGMPTEISFATLHKCISSGGWVLICADPSEEGLFLQVWSATAAAVGFTCT